MDILQTILIPAVITLVSGTIMLVLTKRIEHKHTQELENYKSQIQAELERSKQQLEHELQKSLFQFQTKFSSLHQKQAEVIGELHGKLEDAYEHVAHLVHPVQQGDLKEAEKTTVEKYQALAEFYVKNKIYLDEETSAEVDSVLKTMKAALTKWGFAQSHPRTTNSLQSWHDAWQSVSNEVPPVLKELEGQFRQKLSP